MEVVVHYPQSSSGMKILSRNIAEIHAKTVIEYINKMQFSKEQSEKLIAMICDRVKEC